MVAHQVARGIVSWRSAPMNPDDLLGEGAFELVHALPGRVRLRWLGMGEPRRSLLERLCGAPGVGRVEYRPASRSLIVRCNRDPRASRDAAGCRQNPGRGDDSEPPARTAASVDVDVLLAVGLLATWLTDLFTSRTIRLITLPLLALAGITGYRLYERRQRACDWDVEDTSELM